MTERQQPEKLSVEKPQRLPVVRDNQTVQPFLQKPRSQKTGDQS